MLQFDAEVLDFQNPSEDISTSFLKSKVIITYSFGPYFALVQHIHINLVFNIYLLACGSLFRRQLIHMKRLCLMFHSGFPALQVYLVNLSYKLVLLCVYLHAITKIIMPFRYIHA